MAWLSVHSRSFALASSRARMPVTTTTTATTPATRPKKPTFRRETGERCSVGVRCLRWGGGLGAPSLVYHTKNHRNKHQRRRRGEDQPADHGTAERRVLLAAVAKAERHRRHADDHRKRRHQHGA